MSNKKVFIMINFYLFIIALLLLFNLLLARLESAYSLIWGSHKIWGKVGGNALALL